MEKKHIWVFYQDGGTPEQGWGDRHYFLGKHFDSNRYEVTVFSANDSHMFSHRVEFPGSHWITTYDSVKYCWIKINAYRKGASKRRILSWFIFALKLFFIPKKKIQKPDIIVVSSMPLFPIIPALFYKMIWGTKVILEIRDIWPLTVIELEGYSRANPFVALLRLLEKISYRFSDYLVSVLEKADAHFTDSIKRPVKFAWISNGIDYEVADHEIKLDNDILQHIPKGKFIVGYAGKMSLSNALEFVVAAAAELSNHKEIHFVFVGDGDDREKLVEHSRDLKNISFIPKVKKHLVHELISTFDVAIISFRKIDIYKFGISTNKLFDYMMAARPIIVASSHKHEVYDHSGAILYTDAEDPKAISKTVIEAYQLQKSVLKSMGESGKEFVIKNFLYQDLAKKYERVFDDTLK